MDPKMLKLFDFSHALTGNSEGLFNLHTMKMDGLTFQECLRLFYLYQRVQRFNDRIAREINAMMPKEGTGIEVETEDWPVL